MLLIGDVKHKVIQVICDTCIKFAEELFVVECKISTCPISRRRRAIRDQ